MKGDIFCTDELVIISIWAEQLCIIMSAISTRRAKMGNNLPERGAMRNYSNTDVTKKVQLVAAESLGNFGNMR